MTVPPTRLNTPDAKAIPPGWPAPAVKKPAVAATHYEGPEIYFNDAKLFEQKIVHLNPLQKIGHALKTAFVETPKAAMRGLRGDSRYNFSDFLLLGKVPYYLGGATLAVIFAMGRHGLTLSRQGPAIAMYYLGMGLSAAVIDQAVKWNSGLDLNLKYRTSLGKLQPVFGDPTFSRYDLVPDETYTHMAKKMGIPLDVADPDDEVQATIAKMLPRVRLAKMVLGNAVAAVAAGYIARTDEWHRVFVHIPGVRWRNKPVARLGILLKDSAKVIAKQLGPAKYAKGTGITPTQFALVRNIAMAVLGLAAIGAYNLIRVPNQHKSYQQALRTGEVKPAEIQASPNLSRAHILWELDQQREYGRRGRDIATPFNPYVSSQPARTTNWLGGAQ